MSNSLLQPYIFVDCQKEYEFNHKFYALLKLEYFWPFWQLYDDRQMNESMVTCLFQLILLGILNVFGNWEQYIGERRYCFSQRFSQQGRIHVYVRSGSITWCKHPVLYTFNFSSRNTLKNILVVTKSINFYNFCSGLNLLE